MRLDQLAKQIDAELEGDGAVEIRGLATLDDAGPDEITFLSNPRYAPKVAATKAAAIIVGRDFAQATAIPRLRAADPYGAMSKALALFFRPIEPEAGIHPTAFIHATAQIGADASLGPYCVVGARTRIGARARLEAHVVIGQECDIGDDFLAHPHASVRERVRIGHRVILQNGAVIGGDGFGYVPTPDGIQKLTPAGTVVLEDDVEIGSNTTVDRATIGATRIGRAAKIDNLVMIAHGCDIGEGCFIAGQAGLAGSTKLGRHVQVGGQAGLSGHLEVGDFARIAAQTGVGTDLEGGKTYGSGLTALESSQYRRAVAVWRNLPELVRRVRRLEKSVLGNETGDP